MARTMIDALPPALAMNAVHAAGRRGHVGVVVLVVKIGEGGAIAGTSELTPREALDAVIDYVAIASRDTP